MGFVPDAFLGRRNPRKNSLGSSGARGSVGKVDAGDAIFSKEHNPKKKKKVNLPLAAEPLWYLTDFDRVLAECPLMSWKHSNYWE